MNATAKDAIPASDKKLSREELEKELTKQFNALKRNDFTEVSRQIGGVHWVRRRHP